MKVVYLSLLLSIFVSTIHGALDATCTDTMEISKLDYGFDYLTIELKHACPSSDKIIDYTQKILINGVEKSIFEGSSSSTTKSAQVDLDEFENGACA